MVAAIKTPILTDSASIFAKQILLHQIQQLHLVTERLGDDFDQASALLTSLSKSGRIITIGMGKAGFIAMKIAATFSSMGVPAFFQAPGDAIHGDLGRITSEDIAIVLSNSGETPEVIALLPFLQRQNVKTIAITRDSESRLARGSSVTISLGMISECPPLEVAPTSSTTAMLVVGDALAMSFAQTNSITQKKFAEFHPGGDLGRSLRPVSEIMRTGDNHCIVTEEQLCRDVLHSYTKTPGRPGSASIIDSHGKLVGIFTDGNLRRLLDEGSEFLDKPIGEIMSRNPKTVTPETLNQDAIDLMSAYKIDQLIVISEDSTPVGLIDIQDLVRMFTGS